MAAPAVGVGHKWAQQQHAQAPAMVELSDTASHCCCRALQACVRARDRALNAADRDISKELATLNDALRSTAFGQVFEPAYLDRMLFAAQRRNLKGGEELSLQGDTDGFYVIMNGAVEVSSGPDDRTRPLQVTIRSGHDLPGDSALDKLDPYVVVIFGSRQVQTHVAIDAGPNPEWEWSATIPFGFESELEFLVMEHDTFSRHELLCKGKLGISDFERSGFDGTVALTFCEDDSRAGMRTMSGALQASAGSLSVRLDWQEEGAPTEFVRRDLSVSRFMRTPTNNLNLSATAGSEVPARQTSDEERAHPTSATASMMNSLAAFKKGALQVIASQRMTRSVSEKKPSDPQAAIIAKAPWRGVGYRHGSGHFFGLEEGGGNVSALRPTVLLFVPRRVLRSILQEGSDQLQQQQQTFVRRWLPGAASLEKRALSSFAAAFESGRFSRGHVFCVQGHTAAVDARCIHIIRTGTCRVLHAATPASQTAPPAPTGASPEDGEPAPQGPLLTSRAVEDFDLHRPPVHATAVGLLGVGAVVGCASALFGLPEPFTVAADEPVTVYSISVGDKPASAWPKEVVRALHEMIKRQVEWHGNRLQHTQAASSTVNKLFEEKGDGPPVWRIADSPFLRHKELSTWHSEKLKDRFADEGWTPTTASGGSSGSRSLASSCPALPSVGAAGSASRRPATTSGVAQCAERPLSTGDAAKRPMSAWTPVRTPGGEGLGGVSTPWGAWSPSGMLAHRNAQETANGLARRARARCIERPKERRACSGPSQREAPVQHEVNLRCETDWRKMSSMASKTAVSKMYKMQMRRSAQKLEAFAPR